MFKILLDYQITNLTLALLENSYAYKENSRDINIIVSQRILNKYHKMKGNKIKVIADYFIFPPAYILVGLNESS